VARHRRRSLLPDLRIEGRTDLVSAPLSAHPRHRCYLAPWDPKIATVSPDYAAARKRHIKEVSSVAKLEPVSLSRAAAFE